VLPTSGTARFSSPLGVYDFVKRSSLIEVSAAGAQVLGPIAAELAYGEGLQAHARAAELRLSDRAPAPVAEPFQRAAGGRRQPVNAVLKLQVAPGQRRWWRRWTARWPRWPTNPPAAPWPCSDGDEAVGMMLLYDARLDKDKPGRTALCLAADGRRPPPAPRPGPAGHGLWVIDEARRMGLPEVGLSHVMTPGHAGPFYEAGFCLHRRDRRTAEHEMLLRLAV
jgi:hypothetical protein